MPLISHEVPRNLLPMSRSFNDYDYAFAHLYTDLEFCAFYKDSVNIGRKVLLDNSAFELGKGISNTFGNMVMDLRPTWYVVPDVRHDGPRTMAECEKFMERFPGLPGTAICAIQGDSFAALADCYKFMVERAEKIAIPFDSKGYDQALPPWERRPAFLEKLSSLTIWKEKPLHLFGTYSAKEFMSPVYEKVRFETVDTSNPVTAAAEGWKYGPDGLEKKSSIMLMNESIGKIDETLLLYNIRKFREIVTNHCI